MSASAALATAGKWAVAGYKSITELMQGINDVRDKSISSLTQYVSKTMICGRVYIEDMISGDPLIHNIIKLLNETYCGLIMTALRLNDIVAGGITIRNLVGAVSTEAFENAATKIADEFGSPATEEIQTDTGDVKEGKTKGNQTSVGDIKEVKIEHDASKLFSGRVVEVTFGTGNEKAKINLTVQLFPYIVPGQVLTEFYTTNANPSWFLRFAKWRAGEIKFWRDLVFDVDRIEKRAKALRLDKDGILREVEDHKRGGLFKFFSNIFGAKNTVKNRNAANSMTIISKRRLDAICKDLGLNMKNFLDRQKIMQYTMSMIIVEYDPMYETVQLYMNGIRHVGEYNKQIIQDACKGNSDAIDLKQLLTMLAAGNAPKF